MGQMIMANQYTTTTTNKQCILTNTKQKILCTMPMIKTKTLQIICVIRKKASLGYIIYFFKENSYLTI